MKIKESSLMGIFNAKTGRLAVRGKINNFEVNPKLEIDMISNMIIVTGTFEFPYLTFNGYGVFIEEDFMRAIK